MCGPRQRSRARCGVSVMLTCGWRAAHCRQRFIEEELAKRKRGGADVQQEPQPSAPVDPMAELFKVPAALQVQSSITKTEDMLSSDMLSGIPEVDLGIECVVHRAGFVHERPPRALTVLA